MALIRLTATELMVASYVGSARNVQSLTRGSKARSGIKTETWSWHVEGTCGEMAAAKLLGIYWQPIVGDHDADDVGPYQVRTNTTRKTANTLLRPIDKPDRVFISVLSRAPEFEVIGWLWGAEGKQQRYLHGGDPDYDPIFLVPRCVLHPLDELPDQAAAHTLPLTDLGMTDRIGARP